MNWNHRVFNIKDQNNGEDLFVVRETFYDENNEVLGSTDLSVMSETIDGLKWIAEQIIKGADLPVLLPEKEDINEVANELITHFHSVNLKPGCDLSDIGNEIGIALGKTVNEDKLGYEIDSLIAGIKHGISLRNGTH
jgi:hypothetical protein